MYCVYMTEWSCTAYCVLCTVYSARRAVVRIALNLYSSRKLLFQWILCVLPYARRPIISRGRAYLEDFWDPWDRQRVYKFQGRLLVSSPQDGASCSSSSSSWLVARKTTCHHRVNYQSRTLCAFSPTYRCFV